MEILHHHPAIPGPAHEANVRRVCERDGWQTGNFLKALIRHMRGKLWRTDGDENGFSVNRWVVDYVRELRFRPDAFRFVVEGPPKWGWAVLCIEVLEVVHANPVSADKQNKFDHLFLALNDTDRLNFRAFMTVDGRFLYTLAAEHACPERREVA